MTTMTRRSALGAVSALSALPASTGHSAVADHLGGLIDRHRRDLAALEAVLNQADDLHLAYDAKRVPAIRRQEKAVWRVWDEIAAFPVSTMAEVRQKAAYFREYEKRHGLTDDDSFAFLCSIR